MNEIVALVDQEFKRAERESIQLEETLEECEKELQYSEQEAERHSDELSVLTASISANQQTLDLLRTRKGEIEKEIITPFNEEKIAIKLKQDKGRFPRFKVFLIFLIGSHPAMALAHMMQAEAQCLEKMADRQNQELDELEAIFEVVQAKRQIDIEDLQKTIVEKSTTVEVIHQQGKKQFS